MNTYHALVFPVPATEKAVLEIMSAFAQNNFTLHSGDSSQSPENVYAQHTEALAAGQIIEADMEHVLWPDGSGLVVAPNELPEGKMFIVTLGYTRTHADKAEERSELIARLALSMRAPWVMEHHSGTPADQHAYGLFPENGQNWPIGITGPMFRNLDVPAELLPKIAHAYSRLPGLDFHIKNDYKQESECNS